MSNGYLTSCALIISMIITIILFSKKTINNAETRIFKKMLILNVLESLATTLIVVVALTSNSISAFKLLNRIDINIIIWWCSFFLLYIGKVCKIKNLQKFYYSIGIINILFLILSLFLNVNIIAHDGILNSNGPLTTLGFIGSVIYILLMLMTILISLKNKPDMKKLFPFYFLIALLILIAYLRATIPQINFISIILTLVDLIMIFTIENPDLKILNEYMKNKELVESNIEEKANILFKISQEVRIPIKKINFLSNNIVRSENVSEIHDDARNIRNIANDISKVVNDVLNISSFDKSNIKIIDATYNIYNLFNQIVYFGNEKKNIIDFKYSISSSIPEKLYGDSSRLKQIVCSILNNSFKNTEEGYVDLDIFSIVKYDICRLVITISDTGKGMSLDYINSILEDDKEINHDQLERLTNLDIDLKTVKKLIYLQGGSLLINSDNNGTKCTIVIDQIINSEKKQGYVESMSKLLSNKKKVLLIDDDYKELELFAKDLKKLGLDVTSTMYGKDCIDRLSNNEKFDYIFIDDEMEKYNAVSIIKEIEKLDIDNCKVIIMLGYDKEMIKEHYLVDYPFYDYMIKRIYKDEIIRIVTEKK